MIDKDNMKKAYSELKSAVDTLKQKNIDLNKKYDDLADYDERMKNYFKTNYNASLKKFKHEIIGLNELESFEDNEKPIKGLLKTVPKPDMIDLNEISKMVDEISYHISNIKFPEKMMEGKFNIPEEIKEEVDADIEELNKCFESKCYRSAVIICGRILETALHRKYYDATGFDILEKNPGIGLGKLIAKLGEKNVEFDPGLTQQIHLINQVRISSVHKKQKPFYPTKDQARAIILFTMDSLKKMF